MSLITESFGQLEIPYSNYTSNKYQIQFQYPSAWTIKEKTNRFDEGADIDISNINPRDGVIQISFPMGLSENFGATDVQSAVTGLYQGITSDYTHDYRTIESPSFLNIDGQRSGTFLVTVKQKYETNPVTLAVQTWVTFLGDRAYVIKYVSIPEYFDNPDNIEIRDRFIKSINFLGQSNATSINMTTSDRFGQ